MMLDTLTTLDEATPAALRPVMQPLPAMTPAAARLLAAAGELFYLRGVRGVGVDLIAETAGTTKKTLYDRFGSKDALVALYLLHRAHQWRAHLLTELTDTKLARDNVQPHSDREVSHQRQGVQDGRSAEPAVLTVFQALQSWMGTQRRGCAFVNAYAELGDTTHPAVPIIRAEKAWMRTLFDALAGNPDLGAHLHLLYEGTIIVLTAGDDPDAAADAIRSVQNVMARPA